MRRGQHQEFTALAGSLTRRFSSERISAGTALSVGKVRQWQEGVGSANGNRTRV